VERSEAVTLPPPPRTLGPARALLIFLTFLGMQALPGFVLGFVWGTAGRELTAEAQGAVLMPAAVLGTLIGGAVAWALTWHSLRGPQRSAGLRSLGWSPASRRDCLIAGLVGVVLAVVCLFVLIASFPPSPGHRWGPVVQSVSAGGWSRHLWAALAIIVAPPVEEFMFRGVLFAGFSRSWGMTAAGALVTLLFVVGHLPEVWGYLPATAAVGALGVAALYARVRTQSLIPAVALHAAYNLVLIMAFYAATA